MSDAIAFHQLQIDERQAHPTRVNLKLMTVDRGRNSSIDD